MLKPVYGTGVASTRIRLSRKDTAQKENKVIYFLRISKVPGVGPGENYTGWQVTATTDGN